MYKRQPIILGVSEPANSPELLENYRRSSGKRIAIDGATKTRYEWTRQQRKLETAVRRQKDIATGDGVLRREAQYKIEMCIRDRSNFDARVSELVEYARTRPRKLVGYFQETLSLTNEQMEYYFGDAMRPVSYTHLDVYKRQR